MRIYSAFGRRDWESSKDAKYTRDTMSKPSREKSRPRVQNAATRTGGWRLLTSSRSGSRRRKEARKGRGDAFNTDTHFRFLSGLGSVVSRFPPPGSLGDVRLFPPLGLAPLGTLRVSSSRDSRACYLTRSDSWPFECFGNCRWISEWVELERPPQSLYPAASPQDCSPSA